MSNGYRDPELDDVLQDADLRRIATLLAAAQQPEPPLDDAFRSGLRRQLMNEAWAMSEGRESWWRRAFQPPGLAWASAAAGLLLIAGAVLWYSVQPPGGLQQAVVNSPMDGSQGVALQQPILVAFNQPMDHAATQDAVTITPATNVTFSWNANTLYVTPASGTLAPNTQYQVTVGPGARTASGQKLSSSQTITFVTQPPPSPSPSPTPHPSPSGGLGDRRVAPLGGPTTPAVRWSADSSSVYFVTRSGARDEVAATGGAVTVVAPDGVTSIAISPSGDRLAYIRGANLEVLTFATGHTDELTPQPAPVLVGWSKDVLVWAATDGVYTQGTNGPTQLAAFPTTGTVTAVSISPDGAHVAYTQNQALDVLDVATAKTVTLGRPGDTFDGWSPDGSKLMYASGGSTLVSDAQGNTLATLLAGDASWSAQDAVLVGGDTSLNEVRPDGSGQTKIANGTYRSPVWAPDGTQFAFVRGGSLWTASAPALPPQPTSLDQATALVNDFMTARLDNLPDDASRDLDANAKQDYATGDLNLTITGQPRFSRYYILTSEITGSSPDTARFVVRLVLSRKKIEVKELQETLTLVRDASTGQFVIDHAVAGPQVVPGQGPNVVAVAIAPSSIQVTFDSDLDPATIANGIALVDQNGQSVGVTPTYANRTVTFSGLDLKPGTHLRLEIATALRDVVGNSVANEYDLDLFGPVVKNRSAEKTPTSMTPPSPAATPAQP